MTSNHNLDGNAGPYPVVFRVYSAQKLFLAVVWGLHEVSWQAYPKQEP